jgi:hypothetical protein
VCLLQIIPARKLLLRKGQSRVQISVWERTDIFVVFSVMQENSGLVSQTCLSHPVRFTSMPFVSVGCELLSVTLNE